MAKVVQRKGYPFSRLVQIRDHLASCSAGPFIAVGCRLPDRKRLTQRWLSNTLSRTNLGFRSGLATN
jgi:hypothetical protein